MNEELNIWWWGRGGERGRDCLGRIRTLYISRSYFLTLQTCVIDRVTIYSSLISLIDKFKIFFNFFIITNLLHKFLVHSHKLHKIKFLYIFRAQSAHHQEVNDANCAYAASGIVTLCKWPSCATAKEGKKIQEVGTMTGVSSVGFDSR